MLVSCQPAEGSLLVKEYQTLALSIAIISVKIHSSFEIFDSLSADVWVGDHDCKDLLAQ